LFVFCALWFSTQALARLLEVEREQAAMRERLNLVNAHVDRLYEKDVAGVHLSTIDGNRFSVAGSTTAYASESKWDSRLSTAASFPKETTP
jgi:hypothetical protein